ncbi:hypothetical protein ACFL10_00105 [Patescibacteria group bacterium]
MRLESSQKGNSLPEAKKYLLNIFDAALDKVEEDLNTASSKSTPYEERIELLKKYTQLLKSSSFRRIAIKLETQTAINSLISSGNSELLEVVAREGQLERNWLELLQLHSKEPGIGGERLDIKLSILSEEYKYLN